MKYSVIIPCYKCEATLEKTVTSIQSCGLTDYEIILVDDGSPDSTPALCDRLAAEQDNICCLHQPNGGVSSARNHGLSEAQGDYVWFFDSDDLVDPGSMARASQIIDEYAPDMLIFGMSFDFYRNGVRYDRWNLAYKTEAEYKAEEINEIFQSLYQSNSLTSSCNKLLKRKIMTENGICYNTSMIIMEDFLLVLHMLKHCRSIYTLPQIIYRYYHSAEKSGKNDSAVQRISKIDNLEDYLAPFQEALAAHPETMSALYYMLLEQRLRYQRPAEIAVTGKHFSDGPFSKGAYYEYCPSGNKKTADWLLRHRYFRVYLHHRFRRTVVSILRKTPFYSFLKKHLKAQ